MYIILPYVCTSLECCEVVLLGCCNLVLLGCGSITTNGSVHGCKSRVSVTLFRCHEQRRSYFVKYHDDEWGRCVYDDRLHFEMLSLEGAQCGLSWNTILPSTISMLTALCAMQNLQTLGLGNGARFSTPQCYCVQEEFGSFDAYVRKFVEDETIVLGEREHPRVTGESRELAADLRKRETKFVGPTTMFAYLEAAGLCNCHAPECFAFKECGTQSEEAQV